VVSSLLRIVSLVCMAAVVVSFIAFAGDEAGKGSKETVAEIAAAGSTAKNAPSPPQVNINQVSPSERVETLREERHGSFREAVDDLNDVLTSPFAGVVSSDSIWANRVVAGLLAFLVFGVGLGFLGRYASLRGV
jgi:hypothetical protein